ncbi:hypothetical protein STCU_11989 [Strigomonas culicis]|uniref:Uncharacterized protein n=1 Tax=Strigomonas culicis TaxID=28005 RepID=S9UY68_9TRYP|nr:hypothetical protein STCU_11989 [Strigomonas culicis]|eukprot:EPY15485.1 hypothetical protein STCU_11989 [Strigomonas culicis]
MEALNERIATIRRVNAAVTEPPQTSGGDACGGSPARPRNALLLGSTLCSDLSTFIATPRPSAAAEGPTVSATLPPDTKEGEGHARGESSAPAPSAFQVHAAQEILELIDPATHVADALTPAPPAGIQLLQRDQQATRATLSTSTSPSLRQLDVNVLPSPTLDGVLSGLSRSATRSIHLDTRRQRESCLSQQDKEDKTSNADTTETHIRQEGETNFRALIHHLKSDFNGSQTASADGSQTSMLQRGNRVITIPMSPLQSPFFSSLSAGHSPGPPRITLVKRARPFWSSEGEEDIL